MPDPATNPKRETDAPDIAPTNQIQPCKRGLERRAFRLHNLQLACPLVGKWECYSFLNLFGGHPVSMLSHLHSPTLSTFLASEFSLPFPRPHLCLKPLKLPHRSLLALSATEGPRIFFVNGRHFASATLSLLPDGSESCPCDLTG